MTHEETQRVEATMLRAHQEITIAGQRQSRDQILDVVTRLLDTDHLSPDAVRQLTEIFEEHRQTSNLLAMILPAQVLGTIPILPQPFCTAAETAAA